MAAPTEKAKIERFRERNFLQTFAKNIWKFLRQQEKRQAEVPLYSSFTSPAIRLFESVWFLWINVIIFCIWIALNVGLFNLFRVDQNEQKRVADLIQDTKPEKLAEFIHETFCSKNRRHIQHGN
jgi:hypothetical protein